MSHQYESNRSVHFAKWLGEMNEEKLVLIVELERQTRLLVHLFDLMGDVDEKTFAAVARASRKLQSYYEEVTNDGK